MAKNQKKQGLTKVHAHVVLREVRLKSLRDPSRLLKNRVERANPFS